MAREKSTTLYVYLSDGSQVKVQLTHESEPLPTPNEIPHQRGLMMDEYEQVCEALQSGQASTSCRF